MKIIFEPEDFKSGCGQLLVVNRAKILDVYVYKVGFMHIKDDPGIVYLLISMSDGMTNKFESLEALCKSINKQNLRPMTEKEITLLGTRQHNRFHTEEAK